MPPKRKRSVSPTASSKKSKTKQPKFTSAITHTCDRCNKKFFVPSSNFPKAKTRVNNSWVKHKSRITNNVTPCKARSAAQAKKADKTKNDAAELLQVKSGTEYDADLIDEEEAAEEEEAGSDVEISEEESPTIDKGQKGIKEYMTGKIELPSKEKVVIELSPVSTPTKPTKPAKPTVTPPTKSTRSTASTTPISLISPISSLASSLFPSSLIPSLMTTSSSVSTKKSTVTLTEQDVSESMITITCDGEVFQEVPVNTGYLNVFRITVLNMSESAKGERLAVQATQYSKTITSKMTSDNIIDVIEAPASSGQIENTLVTQLKHSVGISIIAVVKSANPTTTTPQASKDAYDNWMKPDFQINNTIFKTLADYTGRNVILYKESDLPKPELNGSEVMKNATKHSEYKPEFHIKSTLFGKALPKVYKDDICMLQTIHGEWNALFKM